jgi:predicted P-loop ATPase
LPALARDRDQLFAEAMQLYRAGRRWWPDAAAERALIRREQEARFEADAWEETIAQWLVGKTRATLGEIARAALTIETARLGTADQRRIVAVLEREGWRRLPKDSRGNRFWAPTEDHGARRTTLRKCAVMRRGGRCDARETWRRQGNA